MNISKLKITALAACIGVVVAGCGGSSSGGNGGQDNGDVTRTITVIDGYLGNAKVYGDANGNDVADDDELLGYTNKAGQIEVNTSAPIIAKALQGKTVDSAIGPIAQDYQLFAKDGDFVTPFSTIAYKENKSLADIAVELGFSKDLIAGDFVAQSKVESGSDEAKKVYLLARSLVPKLGESDLSGIASELKTKIDELDDLGKENQIVTENGLENAASDDWTLSTYLGNNTYYTYPLNALKLNGEDSDSGSFKLAFDTNSTPETITFSDTNTGESSTQVKLKRTAATPEFYEFVFTPSDDEGCEFDTNNNYLGDDNNDQGECISAVRYDFIYYSTAFAVAVETDKAASQYQNNVWAQSGLVVFTDQSKAKFLNNQEKVDLEEGNHYYLLADVTDENSSNVGTDDEGELNIGANKSLQQVSPTQNGNTLTIDGVSYHVVAQDQDAFVLNQAEKDQISLLFKEQAKATEICQSWKNYYKDITIPGSCEW